MRRQSLNGTFLVLFHKTLNLNDFFRYFEIKFRIRAQTRVVQIPSCQRRRPGQQRMRPMTTPLLRKQIATFLAG